MRKILYLNSIVNKILAGCRALLCFQNLAGYPASQTRNRDTGFQKGRIKGIVSRDSVSNETIGV
jgi:hypothetical protein